MTTTTRPANEYTVYAKYQGRIFGSPAVVSAPHPRAAAGCAFEISTGWAHATELDVYIMDGNHHGPVLTVALCFCRACSGDGMGVCPRKGAR